MISKEIVKHVAKLARINLNEEEIEKFTSQLNAILEAFKAIDEVDVSDVEPSFHPQEIRDIMRDDVVEESLSNEEALSNTEHKEDGYFKGPRVI